MPKIPDCDRCLLYARNPHLVCAIHPEGVKTNHCIDFRLDPNIEPEEKWSPQGYSWYGDELISNKPSKYSQTEQLEILENHPFFTNICPQCGYRFDHSKRIIHYDCPDCGWIDDSL